MKPTKRRQWLDALDEADLGYLAHYHHVCLRTKLESAPVERACARGRD